MSNTEPQVTVSPETAVVRDSPPVFQPPRSLRSAILSGSMTLLVGTAIVSVINLAYNIILARFLGAAGFGHAVSVYTLLMLLSAVTLSFQFVCAKFVAKNISLDTKAAVYKLLHRRSWQTGAVIGATLMLASHSIAAYLNLPSATFITLLGAGTAFYIPLGVRRGLLQGVYDFRRLSINFVLEGVVKLGASIVFLSMHLGVEGVVTAISASVVFAYFTAGPPPELKAASKAQVPESLFEGIQAIVFFVGQVIINNVDILLVKHFFAPAQAGLYAAIAVVGRVVYMSSWSVVSSMFPVSAGVRRGDASGRAVVVTPLLLVVGISLCSLLGLWLLPNVVWRGLFGVGFQLGIADGYSTLPMLYVAATSIYCLSVVLITYEMSRKIANTGWLQLAFSAAIAIGIYVFHNTLHQVIMVQLVLMTVLLACVVVPFVRLGGVEAEEFVDAVKLTNLTKLRRVSEDEVIAEFLRNEFYHPEFHRYWQRLEDLVLTPDLTDQWQNGVRRALLYRRRGRMWNELPPGTEWWQVELEPADLGRVRIFPRSHWRGIASGNFALQQIAGNIRVQAANGINRDFLSKVRSLSTQLRHEEPPANAILMIGIDESSPLTIIEGNHRMVAAMLLSSATVCKRFRFFCGFSPRMTECCWYKTDLSTLWQYTKNSVKYWAGDPDGEIEEKLQHA
jgi:O-antigen/teichoic acid export membrane protein